MDMEDEEDEDNDVDVVIATLPNELSTSDHVSTSQKASLSLLASHESKLHDM